MPLLLTHLIFLLVAVASSGVVKIHSEPGATVLWNDIELGMVGPTGALTVKDVPPGIFSVTIRKEGFETLSTRVKVTPGEQTVTLSLEKKLSTGMTGVVESSPPFDLSRMPPSLASRLTPGLSRTEAPPPPKKRPRTSKAQPPLKLELDSPLDPPPPEETAEEIEEGEGEAMIIEEPLPVAPAEARLQAPEIPGNPVAEKTGSQGSVTVIFLLALLAVLYYLLFRKRGWNARFQPPSEPMPAEGPGPLPGPIPETTDLPITSLKLGGEEELFFLDELKQREKEMEQPVEQIFPRRKRPPVIDIEPNAARFDDEG
jgi:hypothetical protein